MQCPSYGEGKAAKQGRMERQAVRHIHRRQASPTASLHAGLSTKADDCVGGLWIVEHLNIQFLNADYSTPWLGCGGKAVQTSQRMLYRGAYRCLAGEWCPFWTLVLILFRSQMKTVTDHCSVKIHCFPRLAVCCYQVHDIFQVPIQYWTLYGVWR